MFIIGGVGRSGTHLLADILDTSPELTVQYEDTPEFELATNIAVHSNSTDQQEVLASKYRELSNNIVVKHHPAIWAYHHLTLSVPDVKFIVIERDVYQVVASTLRHPGCKEWCVRHKELPPNPLSGSTHWLYREDMNLIQLITLRWMIHQLRIETIKNNSNVFHIHYDDLIKRASLLELANYMGVDNKFKFPPIKPGTTDKWKKELTQGQKDDIKTLVARG